MKKLLYFLLIAFASSMTISSCTDEEIVPKTTNPHGHGGGGSFDPM